MLRRDCRLGNSTFLLAEFLNMTFGYVSHLQHCSSTHTCFLLPRRLAGEVGPLPFSNTFLHPQETAVSGPPCLSPFFVSPFFFLSGIFRNTCKRPRIKVCTSITSLSPHKAGSLCCFTCLNICLVKIIHITDIYIIYIFVWASDPFPELLSRPISLLYLPHHS